MLERLLRRFTEQAPQANVYHVSNLFGEVFGVVFEWGEAGNRRRVIGHGETLDQAVTRVKGELAE